MVSRKEFCEKYRELAEQGKSAREIGHEFGFEGDDKSIALKVSQKATLYRKQFKEFALQQAKEKGLKKAETEALVDETTALIPKLKTRTREADSLADFISELKEKADGGCQDPTGELVNENGVSESDVEATSEPHPEESK